MQELSLNILDIAQNSVRAGASLVAIRLTRNYRENLQTLLIEDNGCGMSEDMVKRVTDPFCTTRTTRKVGLGLPFLKMAAEMTGGQMSIESAPGKGTSVKASFCLNSIDLMPLGDIASTISALVQTSPDMDFIYSYEIAGKNGRQESFEFKTQDAREVLEGVPLSEAAVAIFIRDYINENMKGLLEDEEFARA